MAAPVNPQDARAFLLAHRQELELLLQAWWERKKVGECDETDWEINSAALSDSLVKTWAQVQAVCWDKDYSPEALKTAIDAGLLEVDGDKVRRAQRPIRWSITAGLGLRVDGEEVAAGPLAGLCALGRFLHDLDYPKVTPRILQSFRLGDPHTADEPGGILEYADKYRGRTMYLYPGVARAWLEQARRGETIELPRLSEPTQGLIAQLSAEGVEEDAGAVYLGLAPAQWRAHAAPPSEEPGPFSVFARNLTPAHTDVVAWGLGLRAPYGYSVAYDLLRHLQALGEIEQLAENEWARVGSRNSRGAAVSRWILQQENSEAARALVRSLREELRERALAAGRGWHVDEVARSAHISSVIRQVQELGLSFGCELALALWSDHTYEEHVADRPLYEVLADIVERDVGERREGDPRLRRRSEESTSDHELEQRLLDRGWAALEPGRRLAATALGRGKLAMRRGA